MMKLTGLVLSLLLAVIFAVPAAAADDGQGFVLSVGAYNTDDLSDDTDVEGSPIEVGLEYRFKPFHLGKVPIGIALGASGNEDNSYWAYFSFRYDWKVNERFTITPQTGASYYEEGDGRDLGGPLEFRSGLEFSFRLKQGGRIGLLFYHLSNADIYDENPGSNSLVLNWAF